jgi:hypothetical protein
MLHSRPTSVARFSPRAALWPVEPPSKMMLGAKASQAYIPPKKDEQEIDRQPANSFKTGKAKL